jgi:phage terminase large subunit-like protein
VFTPPLRKLTPRTSRGYEAIAFAEEVLELELFPWQKWLLIHALETLEDGTFRFRTVCLLVARQNGKSTLMQVLSLWRLFVDGVPLVIGTAQNLDIAEEVWQGAVDMAQEAEELAGEIEQVFMQPGKKFLKLASGSRYKVQAASRRGGRGLSGDLILLDELREHQTWEAWSAVTKTTMARALAQVWAASNAGDITSVVLSHLRRLAHRALGDPDGLFADEVADTLDDNIDDESLGIFEWSAAPGRDIWDREGWAEANPSLGHSITERAIAAAAATDPERVFRTEVLCQWVMAMEEGAFPVGVFEAAATSPEVDRFDGKPRLALDVRTGVQQSVSIGAVGNGVSGRDLAVIARYEHGTGRKWSPEQIVGWVTEALREFGVDSIAIDTYGENGHLVPMLQEAGLEVVDLKTSDMRNACVGFHDAVLNGRVGHFAEEPLQVAVVGARRRKSGESWLWSRSVSVTDTGPLMAVAAAWWVHRSTVDDDYDVLDSFY